MKQKGVITVYLTMIFLLVLSVVFTAVESARVQASRLLTETAVDVSLESLLAGYHRQLYNRYGLMFFDGSFGNGGITSELLAGKIREYMDYTLRPTKDTILSSADFYKMNIDNISIGTVTLATDDGGKVFRKQAVEEMRSSIGMDVLESLTADYEWAMDNLENSSTYSEKQQEVEGTLISLEEQKQQVDIEKADEAQTAQSQKNPSAEVNTIKSMGILELVSSDTSKISQKSVDVAALPSQRGLNIGNGLESYADDLVSDLLFSQYLMKYFYHAASEEAKTDGNLQYQLEYLLIGEGHDVDNLKGIVNRLLLMREGVNFVYLLTDQAKVAEAYAAAMLLVGYTGLPPLIEATKYAILLAWAYAESVLDVKVLLAGEKVALIKNASNWKVSLENVGQLAAMDVKQMGDENGIDYEHYMQMLLLVANKEKVTMRALDLIELQMRCDTNRNFKVDHCVYAVEASVDLTTTSVFLSLPFMVHDGKQSEGLAIKRRMGYDLW